MRIIRTTIIIYFLSIITNECETCNTGSDQMDRDSSHESSEHGDLWEIPEDKGDPEKVAVLTLHSPLSSREQQQHEGPENANEHDDNEKPKVQRPAILDETIRSRGEEKTPARKVSRRVKATQLGIATTVRSLAKKQQRDLLLQDFSDIEGIVFPEKGSKKTPRHELGDFLFETYAPLAFQSFRDFFHIKWTEFLKSLTVPLIELSNPGASGSGFYKTPDDQFILKTVQENERKFLQQLLPGYYLNFNQNPSTLLPKFFGLYYYKRIYRWRYEMRIVVMNNLLPSAVRFDQKYDLKGSTHKRRASKHEKAKKSPTLKDLDFLEDHPQGIYLKASTYNALVRAIRRDTLVLEKYEIMDYSLLLGIHNVSASKKEVNVAERKLRITKARTFPFGESGDAFPHGGIQAWSASGQKLLLFVGIIDILQTYTMIKKFEHFWKSAIYDGDGISVHRPDFYASRFRNFTIDVVFKKRPPTDEDGDEDAQSQNDFYENENLPEIIVPHNPKSPKMASIQLGIASDVKNLASQPRRDLLMQDYSLVKSVYFPKKGSATTPAHSFGSFQFYSYAPLAFKYFRSFYDIKPAKFMTSVCMTPWSGFENPGAGGSAFFKSADDQFVLKTVHVTEAKTLLKLFAGYYMNLNQNPKTLLPKFSGFYYYKGGWRKHMRLVVMDNLLPSATQFHQIYDLKGSLDSRFASKKEKNKTSPIFKDLDFMEDHPQGIYLEPSMHKLLIQTLQRDSLVLENFEIMDYSLLMGIHYLPPQTESGLKNANCRSGGTETSSSESSNIEISEEKSGPTKAGMSDERADANIRGLMETHPFEWHHGIPARTAGGAHLLLFIGIIDILQTYGILKQAEHAVKDVFLDGDTVSVHRPGFYARRFRNFMADKVFKEEPSKKPMLSLLRDAALATTEIAHTNLTDNGTESEVHQLTSTDDINLLPAASEALSAKPDPTPTTAVSLSSRSLTSDVRGHPFQTRGPKEFRNMQVQQLSTFLSKNPYSVDGHRQPTPAGADGPRQRQIGHNRDLTLAGG